MRILITGGSSLLGRALQSTKPDEHDIHLTWYTNYTGRPMYQMNISDRLQVAHIFERVKPEIVIHCAAVGSVDYAEQNYNEVYEVNVLGTRIIAKTCCNIGAKLIYISSNAVFGGDEPPYKEDDLRVPANCYGSIKRHAEDVTREARDWVIIRPFMMYGWPYPGGRPNWATIVIDKLSQGQPLKMVDDTYWQPSYAPDVARAIWQLLDEDEQIYHVATTEVVTLYQFARQVAGVFDLDKSLLSPVPSDYFKTIAPRPRDTRFDLSKITARGIKLRGVKAGLKVMKNEKPEE